MWHSEHRETLWSLLYHQNFDQMSGKHVPQICWHLHVGRSCHRFFWTRRSTSGQSDSPLGNLCTYDFDDRILEKCYENWIVTYHSWISMSENSVFCRKSASTSGFNLLFPFPMIRAMISFRSDASVVFEGKRVTERRLKWLSFYGVSFIEGINRLNARCMPNHQIICFMYFNWQEEDRLVLQHRYFVVVECRYQKREERSDWGTSEVLCQEEEEKKKGYDISAPDLIATLFHTNTFRFSLFSLLLSSLLFVLKKNISRTT